MRNRGDLRCCFCDQPDEVCRSVCVEEALVGHGLAKLTSSRGMFDFSVNITVGLEYCTTALFAI